MEREPLLTIEFNDLDIIHMFTYDEWFNEVWENATDDPDISKGLYYIEPGFDTNDITIAGHPEKYIYYLYVFDMDALSKYPYIKRAIEHDEIKKTWLKTQHEETGTSSRN